MDPKKMKIIKSQLREIIREEIQNLKEGLPWERELDEGWFSDLSAKAKQTYLKANPNSKYAKDVKSGERDAPMTGKEKATQADRETQVKKDKEDKAKKQAAAKRIKQERGYAKAAFRDQPQALAFVSDDPAERKQAMKNVTDQLLKKTGFELYPRRIELAIEGGMMDEFQLMSPDGGPLGDLLQNPNKKTLKAFDDALRSEQGYGMEQSLFGVSAKKQAKKAKEKDRDDDSSKRNKSDYGSTFKKMAGGGF